MKKTLALTLSAVLLVSTVLSGCGKKEEAVQAPKGKVQIEFWHSLGSTNGQVIKDLVAEFNNSQQEVEVVETYQGGYVDATAKLQTAIAAGNQPAVAMMERSYVISFAAASALEDMKPYVDKDKIDINDFFSGLMGHSTFDKKLVSLPLNRSTPILYYNKKHFQEVGLDPNVGPKNWDELKSYAKKLTTNGRVGYTSPIEVWYFKALVAQSGGRTLTEDKKNVGFMDGSGAAALDLWQSMVKDGSMKVPPAKDATTITKNDFANEKVSMFVCSTADLNSLIKQIAGKFEIGTAFLPANKNYAVPTGGANVVMLSKSSKEQKEAGWKFVKWLTDTNQAAKFSASTGYIVTRKSALETDTIKKLYQEKPQFKVAVDQLKYAVDTEAAINWLQVKTDVILKNIQAVMYDDKMSAKDAITTIEAESKKILSK